VIISVILIIIAVVEVLVRVVQWFWGWLVQIFTEPTYEPVYTTMPYEIKIRFQDHDYSLKLVTKSTLWAENNSYRLAIPVKNEVFIATETISESLAIFALESCTRAYQNDTSNTLSAYTFFKENAKKIAGEAAFPYYKEKTVYFDYPHKKHLDSTIFNHYHPGKNKNDHLPSHSFFAKPIFT
jgi:hypothetical protein